jgi:hypothetical protein
MNANERELILKEEVFATVGAAMTVSNELAACSPETDIGVH